jgi:hypothetical protein
MEACLLIEVSAYQRLIDEFVHSMSLIDHVCSLILYGSAVKGGIRPGRSDLLDAVIVFSPRFVENEMDFYRTMDSMVDVCTRVAASGVPFHPFHYFILHCGTWSAIRLYSPAWTSDRYSNIARGVDVRPLLHSADKDLAFMGGWYFLTHRTFQRRALLAMTALDSPENRRRATALLREYSRNIAQFACFAGKSPVDRAEARIEITRLYPEVDVTYLDLLSARADDLSDATDIETIRLLLDQALQFNAGLYDAIVARLRGMRLPY